MMLLLEYRQSRRGTGVTEKVLRKLEVNLVLGQLPALSSIKIARLHFQGCDIEKGDPDGANGAAKRPILI